jgi:recombination protein RecA
MVKEKAKTTFADLIEDKFDDFLVFDDRENVQSIKAISTGALSLDICTGVGGIPIGRFTECFGVESSGKTTLALSVCKNAILDGNKVLYIDAENTLDYSYINSVVGDYDQSKLVMYQPNTMEQSLQLCEAGVQSNEYGLIVLDSIGSMSPKKVHDDELTDANVALLSRILTTFVQRNASSIKRSNTAFLAINQIRDKIGAYMATFTTPGGHAWKHILSLRIQLSKADDITSNSEVIGINSKFVIKKNKMAAPFKSYTVPIMFGRGIDTMRDTVQFAEMLGVLEKRGPYYYFEGESVAKGLVNTGIYLSEHKDALDKVKEVCYTIGMNKKDNKKEIIENE